MLAVVAAVIIGLPCFRLRGPYFSLATIASGEITRTLLLHFQGLHGRRQRRAAALPRQ